MLLQLVNYLRIRMLKNCMRGGTRIKRILQRLGYVHKTAPFTSSFFHKLTTKFRVSSGKLRIRARLHKHR